VSTEPRPAASLMVLRDAPAGPEVLLVQRNPEQRFMGGAWVFPGGAVDAGERSETLDRAHRLAAVREVEEEAGIRLDGPETLHLFSRWITPAVVAKRFDTRFFLATAPEGAEPHVDGSECIDWAWLAPSEALARYHAGELVLVFPTIKTLEQIAGFASADELIAWADGREVVPIEPRVVVQGEVARVVLPGEPGYED
jgi:8-oxo-dGTP pyrophosphatase MutT (NUDIX family)